MIQNIFDKELYKVNKKQVIIYSEDERIGYEAPYRMIHNPKNLEDAVRQVESKLDFIIKSIEYFYLIDSLSIIDSSFKFEKLNNDERVNVLRDACKNDVEDADISAYDANVYGAFIDDELVGICSYYEFYGYQSIAVLVHPDYRNFGVASCLVAYVTKIIMNNKQKALYHVNILNESSQRVAENVGFHKQVTKIIYELEEM